MLFKIPILELKTSPLGIKAVASQYAHILSNCVLTNGGINVIINIILNFWRFLWIIKYIHRRRFA